MLPNCAPRNAMTEALELPSVLAAPPWVPARKRKKLVLAEPERPERIVWWEPGEKARWADPYPEVGADRDKFAMMPQADRDKEILGLFEAVGIVPIYAGRHLSREALLSALERAQPRFVEHYRLAHIALARFGLDVLGALLALFDRAPGVTFDCFRRVDSIRVATK